MNKFIRNQKYKNENRLRQLQSKNSKDYWKILNSLNKKPNTKYPELKKMYEHFKTIGSNNNCE